MRSALLIATCLGFASYGLLDGLGYFGPGLRYDQQVALSNVNGMLLILTFCSAIMELILAVGDRSGASSPTPPRPDLGSHPR